MRYLLCTAALVAAQLTASQELTHRIHQLEEQMKELRVETMNGNFGAKTASAYPNLHSWGLYTSIEGLYMKLYEGGTDYAFDQSEALASNYTGKIKYLDFNWRFAFRVTAGYQFENPDWDTWAEYMRFATTQQNETTIAAGGAINSNIYAISGIQKAQIKMDFNFNVVDWNAGRLFFIAKNFSLHPFAGVRGSFIYQEQNTPITTLINVTNFRQHNNTWGVGIRTGSRARWYFSNNWSLFGSAAVSMMYTNFSNKARLYRTINETSSDILKLDLGTRRVLPNTTIDAGLSWETTFANQRTCLRLSAGYEFDYWWRQNQMIHIKSDTEYSYYRLSEDLSLQGVKLNAAFDF